jgi:hypothetical protein
MENKNTSSPEGEVENLNTEETNTQPIDIGECASVQTEEILQIPETPEIEMVEEFYDSHGKLTTDDQILSVFRNFISTKEEIKE